MIGVLQVANLQTSAASEAVQGHAIAAQHRSVGMQIDRAQDVIRIEGIRKAWAIRRNRDIALAILPRGHVDTARCVQRFLNARGCRANRRFSWIGMVRSKGDRSRLQSRSATSGNYIDRFAVSTARYKNLIASSTRRV